jgi:kumamolisin
VALFELDGYTPSNVNTYLRHYNLGSSKFSNVLIDGARNTAGSGAPEVELDMEVISAIAPQARQKVYIGPNTANGALDLYNRIVSDNSAKVVSISWGQCERDTGTALVDAMDNVFKQGVAQGQAFFAASGDSGAYGCDDKQLNVDYPAGDPHVVGVGGTNLSINSDNTYASESAWSSPSGQRVGGGGGGISQHFSRPAYQDGVQSNAKRAVPDVSADADINSGYSLYIQGHWDIVGGTSAAAPLWAGIATNINQYLKAQNKPTLGSGHEALYSLYKNQQQYAPYHDVTRGNNLYYNARQGYDMATGMGTPNAWNIARDLAAKRNSTTSSGSTGTTTGGDTSGSGSTNTGGNTGGDTSGSGNTNTGGNTGSPGYPGGGYPYPGGNNGYPGGGYPYPGDNSGYPSYGPNW